MPPKPNPQALRRVGVRVEVTLPPGVATELDEACKASRTSRNALVTWLVTRWLDEGARRDWED